MKRFLSFLLMCLIAGTSFAQNTDYYNRMNHVFGAIDKSKVTTGLLKEFGVRLNHVENDTDDVKHYKENKLKININLFQLLT